MTPDRTLLLPDEVAEICSVSAETVRRWVREGRLKAIKLPGGQVRFRAADIDMLLTPSEEIA